MKNPRAIQVLVLGATYLAPTFSVTDEGIQDAEPVTIEFCKGNKDDGSFLRQKGFFDATLLQVVKQYLEDVNVGPLATRETSMAITKIDEAIMWLAKRTEDRRIRDVLATYQK